MEAVLLRCPPWGSELRREVPPDREFVAAHCLCKSAGEVRAIHSPVRMVEVVRVQMDGPFPSADA